MASYKNMVVCVLVGAILWVGWGILNSFIFSHITKTTGYYYGTLPGAIIGAIIGAITSIWRKDVGMIAGCIIGSIASFFLVATLSNPLPVDGPLFGIKEFRYPILVAIPGGIFGAISGYIIDMFGGEKNVNFKNEEMV